MPAWIHLGQKPDRSREIRVEEGEPDLLREQGRKRNGQQQDTGKCPYLTRQIGDPGSAEPEYVLQLAVKDAVRVDMGVAERGPLEKNDTARKHYREHRAHRRAGLDAAEIADKLDCSRGDQGRHQGAGEHREGRKGAGDHETDDDAGQDRMGDRIPEQAFAAQHQEVPQKSAKSAGEGGGGEGRQVYAPELAHGSDRSSMRTASAGTGAIPQAARSGTASGISARHRSHSSSRANAAWPRSVGMPFRVQPNSPVPG